LGTAWIPLEERTTEEREEIVATCFVEDKFDIRPLKSDVKTFTVPRAKHWYEQMVVSTSVKVSEEALKASTGVKVKENALSAPWGKGPVTLKVVSMCVSEVELHRIDGSDLAVIKEKVLSRDSCWTKNGITVPGLQVDSVGEYTLDTTANKLESLGRASVVNGVVHMAFVYDVPIWLLPAREFTVGETWVQFGPNFPLAPKEDALPKVESTVKRLVVFEGRRAVEIVSTSTYNDYSRGIDVPVVRRVEERHCYFDLETGEPLWSERRSKDGSSVDLVIRSFSQSLKKHLIRTTEK
jgi:hypothetical protein